MGVQFPEYPEARARAADEERSAAAGKFNSRTHPPNDSFHIYHSNVSKNLSRFPLLLAKLFLNIMRGVVLFTILLVKNNLKTVCFVLC